MSNMKNLADILKVCSILPIFAVMPAMGAEVLGEDLEISNRVFENYVKSDLTGSSVDGAALSYSTKSGTSPTLTIKNSVFKNNKVYDIDKANGAYGGAVGVSGNINAVLENVDFISNLADTSSDEATTAKNQGGAWYQSGGTFNGTNLKFVNNKTTGNTGNQGAALMIYGASGSITGSEFINNFSDATGVSFRNEGGALFLNANADGFKISDTLFQGNRVESMWTSGGAISLRGNVVFDGVDFINNAAVGDEAEGSGYGGAVLAAKADVTFSNGDFEGNKASTNGGAFHAASSVTSAVFNNVNFEDNSAGSKGGAIYTETDMKVSSGEFEDNVAEVGGAVYNLGNLTIENAEFEGNKAIGSKADAGALFSNTGTLKLVNTNFIGNSAEGNPIDDYGYGGAIFAQGGIIDIQGGKFSGNKALAGGAIYVSKSATSANFQDVIFDGNQASVTGALGVFGKNTTLTNVTFTNNSTTGSYVGYTDAGALFVGAVAQVEINNSTFTGNKSAASGGAIATRSVMNPAGTKNGMKDAMLDIIGGTFTGNIANTQGGAIYNTVYNSKNALGFAYVGDSTFTSNEALEGGAIYNVGIIDAHEGQAKMALNDVTFTGNKAAAFGGAIYNEDGGTIVLTGENTFVNNTAKGGANDIHNLGTLEIASGTTTISGGISGTGSLAIAKGTVLNIGTSTIVQDKIEIDGTVTASVLSERSFGRLLGDVEADRDAKLELTVGAVGTYKIFDDDVDIDIAAGSAFVVTNNGADGVVIETKSVEDLAADTGLTTNAAAVVAGLANADSRAMQQISLAAQVALNAGDNATVEAETAKVTPDDKPVAQSVAMSVQNQVLNMAANRMAAVTPMGRSGGDTPMAAGAWVQGMFNKSKLNDQFHGYSRGFALGGDTVIADAFTIGGGYAYGTTDVHADNRDTDIESSTIFMYAQYKPTNWYLNATLSYTMAEYEEQATVFGMPMVNTYDVDSYGAQMMTGYTFASGITPEMGVRYLYVESDDYNNGLGDITVEDTQYLAGVMGLKYAFEIESDWALKLRPELRAAATYDFLSDEAIATVTMPGAPAYVVNGDRLSRMGGEFGIGLTAEYKGLNVSLTYDLDLHKDYTSQTGMLKFRYNF